MADNTKEKDLDQFHNPKTLLLALVGDQVGELSEIFKWKGEAPKGLPDRNEEDKAHLSEELSDVLLNLVRLNDVRGSEIGEEEKEKKMRLGEVLSDAMLYIIRLSDISGIDLSKAVLNKMAINNNNNNNAIVNPIGSCDASTSNSG